MPKQLPILINPNPTLRKKSLEILTKDFSDKEFQELLLNMEETMIKKDGAGLAAPQVGKSIRLIVISHKKKTLFLINPEITKKSWARETAEEGCLSVLNEQREIIYALVERHKIFNFVY